MWFFYTLFFLPDGNKKNKKKSHEYLEATTDVACRDLTLEPWGPRGDPLIGKGLSNLTQDLVKISCILFVLYFKMFVSNASARVFLVMIKQHNTFVSMELLLNKS